jgi:N-acetylglutamate synthase-like GNAT family acetyltransferase
VLTVFIEHFGLIRVGAFLVLSFAILITITNTVMNYTIYSPNGGLIAVLSILIFSAILYAALRVCMNLFYKMGSEYVQQSLSSDLSDIQKHYFNESDNHLWVAIDDNNGEVIGCVAIDRIDDSTCELKRMSVRRDIRRRGVGEALMRILEAHCKGKCKKILLGTSSLQQPAIALYKKHGFRVVAEKGAATFVPIKFLRLVKDI